MFLNKIPKDDWSKFIIKNFKSSGKTIPQKLAKLIPTLVENHSWYVQQFSAYTWRLTENKTTILEMSGALMELIETNMPLYQKEIESLPAKQINLLKAIYDGEEQLTSKHVMQKYDIGTPINIIRNRQSLEKNDIIYPLEAKKYDFLDPVLKLWFKQEYYNKDLSELIS